jgi:hypothetical protein
MKKNVASQTIGAQMVTAADGTAFTGTVTVVITGDAGTQSASGGTGPTHEGNGYYSYLPTQAETNFDHVAFTFIGTGAVPATVQVYPSFPQTGDSFGRIGATGSGLTSLASQASVDTIDDFLDTEIAAILAAVDTEVAAILSDTTAILADTGTDGVVVAAASKTGYALSAAGVDGVLDEVVEGSTTFRQMLRGYASALLAILAGAATSTVTVRDLANTKDRITATVDADGNRTAVVLDLT